MFRRLRKNRCRCNRNLEVREIDYQELVQRVKTGAVLLDVRSPQEYREGHLEGAILVPDYEIMGKIENKIKNKEQEIVLYCRSGSRAKRAYNVMDRLGYKNMYNLRDGLDGI